MLARRAAQIGAISPATLIDASLMNAIDPRMTFARASAATDGFYTDAPGSSYNSFAINQPRFDPANGLILEDTTTNYLLNSDAPVASQSPSLAGAGRVYRLWMIGTGSVTVAAGTATGSGWGTVSAGSFLNVTVTTGGTVVVTTTGSVNRYQLEYNNNPVPSTYVATAGAAATRASEFLTAPVVACSLGAALAFEGAVRMATAAQISAFLQLDDGTFNNRMTLYQQAGNLNSRSGDWYTANTPDAGVIGAGLPAGTPFRLAASCSPSLLTHVVGNSNPLSAPVAHWPGASFNRLLVGSNGSAVQGMFGFVRRVRFWAQPLDAVTLRRAVS